MFGKYVLWNSKSILVCCATCIKVENLISFSLVMLHCILCLWYLIFVKYFDVAIVFIFYCIRCQHIGLCNENRWTNFVWEIQKFSLTQRLLLKREKLARKTVSSIREHFTPMSQHMISKDATLLRYSVTYYIHILNHNFSIVFFFSSACNFLRGTHLL